MKVSAGTATEVAPDTMTVTSTLPATADGEVAVHRVTVAQVTAVAATDPKLTVPGPATNPVPVMVMTVPPPRGPAEGVMAETVGR